jgi:TonB family protein
MVMKRIPQSLFLALFVFAISSFAQTQPWQKMLEELWKEFSSTAGSFKVALPGNPTETSKTVELTLALGKIERHMFTLEAGFATFLVSYSDLPVIMDDPDEINEFLDHHIHEGAVTSSQGKLLSKTEIELDGYPGRELIVKTPNSTFRIRRYLVGQRFYQIAISMQRENDPAKNAAEITRSMDLTASKFFDSFKLTSKPVNEVDIGSALNKVAPAYPEEARAARVSGKVEVQVIISEEGRVIKASAISGPEMLREAAVQAAKEWVFKPTKADGLPVKVQGILTFNFTLQ